MSLSKEERLDLIRQKQEVINALEVAIRTTREGKHIAKLIYSGDENLANERVVIVYDNDYTKFVNVTGDSGVAMMQEVLRELMK